MVYFLNASGGYICNLGRMLQCFNISKKETILFTIDDSNYVCGRIFQQDGKEIDYVSRIQGVHAKLCSTWVCSVNWNVSGMSSDVTYLIFSLHHKIDKD